MLPREDIRRLVVSLLAEEIGRLRRRSVPAHEAAGWGDGEPLGEDGLGLDSLGLLEAAGRCNQFFHLHEVGIEDYLLVRRTIGGWVEVVEASLERRFERVTFQTSGSTGVPKPCTHELALLRQEIDALAGLLPAGRRIVAMVPPHHIFGFLFTVLLPRRLGVPVLDARDMAPGRLAGMLAPGDLVIATPFLWRYMLTSLGGFPSGIAGVTSTAPMPADLAADLLARGLDELVEVYGSSETGGVGLRSSSVAAFRLMPHWTRVLATDGLLRRNPDGSTAEFETPDLLAWDDDWSFRPRGRRDGAVQVGGVNVFPERVAGVLRAVPGVADCAVRLAAAGEADAAARLKAFVVPSPGLVPEQLEADLRRHASDELTPPERPVAFTFGDGLPRSAMGKLADW